jgi:catechol-2,3-dioxygenase
MQVALSRVILYVQDVDRLAGFYQRIFALPVIEEIEGDWAVLDAGPCQLALHKVGKAYRVADPSSWQVESNVKLVMSVNRPLADFRAELVANGVPMDDVKLYPPLTGLLCDGTDPEGNVFQLAEATTAPRPR